MALWSVGLLTLCVICSTSAESLFRLCVTNDKKGTNLCQLVQRGNSLVECVWVADSVDCALKLQQGLADFGVFSAEEALLASNFIDKSAQVIADIRHKDKANENFAFQAVAVVRSDFSGNLLDLKGKNLCHPGFAPGQTWTDAVLKHFERSVVPTPCREEMPSVEQSISALSEFFNESCRPGPWVQDDFLDAKLKQTYSNLCALCDSQKSCTYNTHSTGTHQAALQCLTRSGDVAYVALEYVKQYFGLLPGFEAKATETSYKYLCPDGSSQPLSSATPCTWQQQPWPSVLVRSVKAVALQANLVNWLNAENKEIWQQALSQLMVESDHVAGNVTALLSNYVRQGGETVQGCNGKVKWCTTSSQEQRKCEWLSAAVQGHGIQPQIACVPAADQWECFNHLHVGLADIVATDTEYGFIARKSFGLIPLAYQDGMDAGNYHIIAVLTATNNNIRNWKDCRQKRVCFPEYGGLAWISTVATLRDHRLLTRLCPHSLALGKYFSGGCVPGANDKTHVRGSGLVPASLCSLCTGPAAVKPNSTDGPCSTTFSNMFYGDLGALRCLASGSGDIAILDYRQLLEGKSGGLAEDIEPSAYKVLCRNGSLAQYKGLNVDHNCALGVGVGSEVLIRGNLPESKQIDLSELLLQMDVWFGAASTHVEGVFHMYHKFQDTKDLLFKDTTVGLILPQDTNYRLVNAYTKLQAQNANCTRSTAASILPVSLIITTVLALTIRITL